MSEQKYHLGIKALIMNENNEILILKANPDELKQQGKTSDAEHRQAVAHWDLPGGRVKKGDSIEETLLKECEEELGTRGIEIIEPFDFMVSNMKIPEGDEMLGLILFVYLCRTSQRKFALSSEHTEYRWASVSEAKELLAFKYPQSFIKKLGSIRNG